MELKKSQNEVAKLQELLDKAYGKHNRPSAVALTKSNQSLTRASPVSRKSEPAIFTSLEVNTMRDSSKNNQTFGGAGPAVPVNNSQLTNDLEAQIEANNKLKEMVAKLTDAIHT